MFAKPFRVKSSTITRGSDRRRIKQNICQSFPALSQDELDQVLPGKATMSTINIITHSGSTIVVYVVDGEPLMFEQESVLHPSVYLLWKLPNVLHCVTTWAPVIDKLHGGADLMLPGVVTETRGGCSLQGIEKGQVCALNAMGNSTPVGVVVALMSHEEMMSCDMRGKGFRTAHLYGDHLWEMGSKVHPPVVPMTSENEGCGLSDLNAGGPDDPSREHKEEEEEIRAPTSAIGSSDELSDAVVGVDEGLGLDSTPAPDLLCEPLQQLSCSGEGEGDPVTTMDALLKDCFLQALKSRVTQGDLPILVSTFYKAHMVEPCHSGLRLDIKKSSYKKLSKFLAEMQAQGLVEVKENSKGAEIITALHLGHPLLKSFVPTVLVQPQPESSPLPSSQTAPIESKVMEYKHLYMPTHKMSAIFGGHGYGKNSMLEVGQVREMVTSYIKANDLVAKDNPRMVVLDPVLTDIMYKKGEEPPTRGTWQEVMERVLQGMNLAHSLTMSDGNTIMRKGRLEPIVLSVVRRASNKNCTLVDNLELYGIVPDEFARTMQRLAAASTTVTEVAGRAGGHQVMVQGNAIKSIAKLLQETYGIPLQCIEGLDKIKKSGQR